MDSMMNPMGAAPLPADAAPSGPPSGGGDPIIELLQAVMAKWQNGETMIAGEKQALVQTLMMLAGAQPPSPHDAFVEGQPAAMGMQDAEGPAEDLGEDPTQDVGPA